MIYVRIKSLNLTGYVQHVDEIKSGLEYYVRYRTAPDHGYIGKKFKASDLETLNPKPI